MLAQFQILCLPGGFSYGDDIAAGRILANQIRHHLAEPLAEFRAAGKLMLGICNGFQILIKSGLLLDVDRPTAPRPRSRGTTPASSRTAGCICERAGRPAMRPRKIPARSFRTVSSCEGSSGCTCRSRMRKGVSSPAMRPPSPGWSRRASSCCATRVLRPAAIRPMTNAASPIPANPNGAAANVAGICDTTGRVFGLMPHPERHIDPTHHPRWTRGEGRPEGDGLRLFRNAVEYFA